MSRRYDSWPRANPGKSRTSVGSGSQTVKASSLMKLDPSHYSGLIHGVHSENRPL